MRPFIRPYVEVSPVLSEFYQAERLQTEDVDLLQLMWADFKNAPSCHFYIKEVAQMNDGSFVVPMKWIVVVDHEQKETYCADVYKSAYNKQVSNHNKDSNASAAVLIWMLGWMLDAVVRPTNSSKVCGLTA